MEYIRTFINNLSDEVRQTAFCKENTLFLEIQSWKAYRCNQHINAVAADVTLGQKTCRNEFIMQKKAVVPLTF